MEMIQKDAELKNFIARREPGDHQFNPSLKKRKLSPKEIKQLAQGHRAKKDRIQVSSWSARYKILALHHYH